MGNNKMTQWGVGSKMVRGTFLTAVVIFTLQFAVFPDFRMPLSFGQGVFLGCAWFCLGIFIWIDGAMKIKQNFFRGNLVTSGVYRYIQHPIYSAFIFFYLPGIAIMTRSYLAIVLPCVFYFLYQRHIGVEEEWLHKTFGARYDEYKKRTGRLVPNMRLFGS